MVTYIFFPSLMTNNVDREMLRVSSGLFSEGFLSQLRARVENSHVDVCTTLATMMNIFELGAKVAKNWPNCVMSEQMLSYPARTSAVSSSDSASSSKWKSAE